MLKVNKISLEITKDSITFFILIVVKQFKVKIGTLHKKLNQLYEQGRYWIQEK